MAGEREPNDNFNPLDTVDLDKLPDEWLVHINYYQQVEQPWWDQQMENIRRQNEELDQEA